MANIFSLLLSFSLLFTLCVSHTLFISLSRQNCRATNLWEAGTTSTIMLCAPFALYKLSGGAEETPTSDEGTVRERGLAAALVSCRGLKFPFVPPKTRSVT